MIRKLAEGEGFAVFSLGDVEVVALCDGHVDMPVSRLRLAGDAALPDEALAGVPRVGGQLRLSVNAFLIRHGGASLLIDTGAGDAWHATMGRVPAALARAGIDPATIGAVALTHTHIDHLSGLALPDGRPAFPAASVIHVPAAEMELFAAEPRMAPFRALCRPLSAGQNLLGCVTAVAAPGHEVGHTSYRVQGSEGGVLIWGDLVHVPALQFARPEVTWEFDADQDRARTSREALLRLVVAEDLAVAGAHLDFPGLGRVAQAGQGYSFTPL